LDRCIIACSNRCEELKPVAIGSVDDPRDDLTGESYALVVRANHVTNLDLVAISRK
jgi:hypothetical protein